MLLHYRTWLCIFALLAGAAVNAADEVDTTPSANRAGSSQKVNNDAEALQEIIVTAQKREQSVNSIGMSITAVSGEQLTQLGVSNVADLTKLVPGFTYALTQAGTPVYSIRGVGFYETSLAATPAVAVYVDEVPLPYPAMTAGASLDLGRVEVLKGPQGTLYGQNSTGGAINYVAAKPTDTYQAGFDASYSRFNTTDLQGFISGPINEQLSARLALRTTQGGDWQESYTHLASLGATNETEGRVLIDWHPTDKLKFELNLNGWINDSDTQAGQLIALRLAVPGNEQPAEVNYPLAPQNARAADWDANTRWRENNTFYQSALRTTYALSPDLKVTSITAYESLSKDEPLDADGTAIAISDYQLNGRINSVSQELRLSEDTDKVHAMIGANFQHDTIFERSEVTVTDSSDALKVGSNVLDSATNFTDQKVSTYAAFSNVEYNVLPNLSLQAGVRYAEANRDFSGCTYTTDAGGAAVFTAVESELKGGASVAPIAPYQCVTFNAQYTPALVTGKLNQDNVSWRAGLNWNPAGDTLLYANVSKGYKSGSYPTVSASSYAQYAPVSQESLLAYEVGFKAPLLEKRLQFNGAIFYYQYVDKQLRSKELDPVFGPLDNLINVPKSHVKGAELDVKWTPLEGLILDVGATHIETDIVQFVGYNEAGVLANYARSPFPFSPKWQVTSDLQYTWHLNDKLSAFIGGNVEYHSATTAEIGSDPLFAIRAHTVLDLRGGVQSQDGKWRLELWDKNATNEYYWNNIYERVDSIVRYAAMPETFGATLSYRFK